MSEHALYHEDERARAQALDPAHSYIVQAPAGSGKTELLIQRFLGLLATVEAPEEVLAITFTRKAAAEMQARVLAALENAGASDDGLLPHEQTTRRFARAVMIRDRKQGWHILRHAQRLKIQTLDSLNASIARMLPVTAAANVAGNAVADEAQTKALYRQAAVASLEWVNSDSDYASAIETLLAHLDNNTALYVDYLADMLRVRDQWLPVIGGGLGAPGDFDRLREQLEADLVSIRDEQVENAKQHVSAEQRAALSEIGQVATSNLVADGKGTHAIIGLTESSDSVGWWRGVAELLLTAKGEWRKRISKTIGLPPEAADAKAALNDLIVELQRVPGVDLVLQGIRELPPPVYDDSQWRVLVALIRLLPLVVFELEQSFARKGLTDFVEVARAADAALGDDEAPSDIALLLDYQVRHILVDEMQDTSLAQYEMLRALTRGWTSDDSRTLFCVGDPMQSIYRFRNAEVAQFLTARRDGIGGIPLRELILRRNFRSGEYLVDWFNQVFPTVLPGEDDPVNSAVAYAESVATEAHLGKGDIRIHPALGTSKATEADVGFELVRQLVDEHPNDSIAVLVRGRTVLPDLLVRLKSAGIDYEAVDIDRLTDLPESIDVLSLARAAVHPADRHAWLAILRAPWIGLSWVDIHALVLNDDASTVPELLADRERIERLSDDGQTALRQALPILDQLARPRRFESLREVIEQTWLRLGGHLIPDSPDAIDNVYRLLDVIGKLEQAGTLDDVAELEAELDQERVSSLRPGQLAVMTMHKAKGLQFDHVVLYGLGRRPRSSGSDVLNWLELPPEDGRNRNVLSPIGPRAVTEKDPIHAYISNITRQRDQFETGRLLYVACTRAIKSLHLVGHAEVSDDGTTVKRPAPSSLLFLLWPFAQQTFEEALAVSGIPETGEDEIWALPVLRRFAEPWSPPEITDIPGSTGSDSVMADVVEFDWAGSNARHAGTLVHRWLHRVITAGVDFDDYMHAGSSGLFSFWLDEAAAPPEARMDILARTREALGIMSNDDRGRWLVSGEGHAELSLTGVVDGQVVTGIIDRVRVDDGTHWIVDYKTSSHEGGNLDGFLAAESDRYRSQLARYRQLYEAWCGQPARCALYFPLLARFVEVEA